MPIRTIKREINHIEFYFNMRGSDYQLRDTPDLDTFVNDVFDALYEGIINGAVKIRLSEVANPFLDKRSLTFYICNDKEVSEVVRGDPTVPAHMCSCTFGKARDGFYNYITQADENFLCIRDRLIAAGLVADDVSTSDALNIMSGIVFGDVEKEDHTKFEPVPHKELPDGLVERPKSIVNPTTITTNRYILGDAIRKSVLYRGRDSWCTVADDVFHQHFNGTSKP